MNSIQIDIKKKLGDIKSFDPLGGGSIGQNFKLVTVSGKYFLKTGISPEMIQAEALGLKELANSNTIKTPSILEVDSRFLLLEWIENKSSINPEDFYEFGNNLAKLHRWTNVNYGFTENNFIGSTPQINKPSNSWLEFFWNERLMFQIELAYRKYKLDSTLKDLIFDLDLIYEQFIGPSIDVPSLIHGDLWSGNFLIDPTGKAVIFDSAIAYAHREFELSMTYLFGGFSPHFYQGYNNEWPLKDGFKERIEFYQIYHLLNHLNLFGISYYDQIIRLLRKYS